MSEAGANSVNVSAEDARAGVTGHNVRYVLAASLLGAVAGLLVAVAMV